MKLVKPNLQEIQGFFVFVDTASVYGNETDIGSFLPELMKTYSLERKDLFITSKLGKCHAASAVENVSLCLGID